MPSPAHLPLPDSDGQAHSARLAERIKAEIEAAGGWISFARYMELALYAPGLGYYTAGARKFGLDGDFVTAPELTPLFGQALASQVAQVLELTDGEVLELGAGSGRLALDLLLALEGEGRLPARYGILEVSADLRQRQRQLFEAAAPRLLDRLAWLDALPERFSGMVLANEVLDALPVHLVHWQAAGLLERGVGWRAPGEAGSPGQQGGFAWADRPVADPALASLARALPVAGDYLSEVSLAGPALVRSLGMLLDAGCILLLDYGFPRAEFYHAQRRSGTLMCHYRHHAFDDPFFLPGLTDITAHVDFTAVADAALEAGIEVMGYATQAHFLVNCGVLERLADLAPGSPAYLRQAAAVQKLLSPSEMGELFKVMALGKGLDRPLIGFGRGDRRHTL